MAAPTFQAVIDRARLTLNDDDKARYTDAEALVYANEGIDAMFALAPELFIGHYSDAALTDGAHYALGDPVPVVGRAAHALTAYIIGRCEAKDEEAANTNRASFALTYFKSFLSPS